MICIIVLISHIANFSLSVRFIISVQLRIFPLNMRDTIVYVALWWEKYLSKRSLIKHTCSWRDKLIVLWTLNGQAKIFLCISNKSAEYLGRACNNYIYLHVCICLCVYIYIYICSILIMEGVFYMYIDYGWGNNYTAE